MPTCALNATEKLASLAHRLGDDSGGDFVHLEPAVASAGMSAAIEAQLAGLAEQALVTVKFLASISAAAGTTSLATNSAGGLGDLPVFAGEVFRRENILWQAIFDEEAAAFRRFGRQIYFAGCHSVFLLLVR